MELVKQMKRKLGTLFVLYGSSGKRATHLNVMGYIAASFFVFWRDDRKVRKYPLGLLL